VLASTKIRVVNCCFIDLWNGIYYSLSCNNTTIQDCVFDSNNVAIQGENTSDHGAFGFTSATGCSFVSQQNLALVVSGSSYLKLHVYQQQHKQHVHSLLFFWGSSGSFFTKVSNCTFFDNQPTPTQVIPITFDRACTFLEVHFVSCSLNAYSLYALLGCYSSAVLGSNVVLLNCANVSGTLPMGIILFDLATLSCKRFEIFQLFKTQLVHLFI